MPRLWSGVRAPGVPEEKYPGGCRLAPVQASGQQCQRSLGGKHLFWAVGAHIEAPA